MELKKEFELFLPITEATFFIMLSLSPGPKHGYAIMKEVSQMSRGRVMFSTGTLYGAIKRLLDLGWIVRDDEGEEGGDETSRSRKNYALTSLGRKVLVSEVNRMKDLIALAATLQSEGI